MNLPEREITEEKKLNVKQFKNWQFKIKIRQRNEGYRITFQITTK